MVTLLVGGLIAAPIAAWMVSRLDHRLLGGLVGGMILICNAEGVLSLVGVSGEAVVLARVAIVISTVSISGYAIRDRRRTQTVASGADQATSVRHCEAGTTPTA